MNFKDSILLMSCIKKIIIKVALIIGFCIILSIVLSSFTPMISNDLALGQLENEDINWSLMNIWTQIQNYSYFGYIIIVAIGIFSIGKDIYKYYDMKEDI